MRKYLREIHTKSDAHKKRFAFLVSAGCTLAIFSVWSFVRFGAGAGAPAIAVTDGSGNAGAVLLATDSQPAAASNEDNPATVMVTPFQNLKASLSQSLSGLKHSIDNGN